MQGADCTLQIDRLIACCSPAWKAAPDAGIAPRSYHWLRAFSEWLCWELRPKRKLRSLPGAAGLAASSVYRKQEDGVFRYMRYLYLPQASLVQDSDVGYGRSRTCYTSYLTEFSTSKLD